MVGAGGTRRSLSAAVGGPEGPRRGFRLARPGVIAHPTAGRARRPRRDLTGTGRPGSSPRLPPAAVLTLGVPPAPSAAGPHSHHPRDPRTQPGHLDRNPHPERATSHRAPPDGHLPTRPGHPTGRDGARGRGRCTPCASRRSSSPGGRRAAGRSACASGPSGACIRSGAAALLLAAGGLRRSLRAPARTGRGSGSPGRLGRRPVSEGGEGSPARPRTGPGSSDGARAGAGLRAAHRVATARCARSPRIVRASSWPRGRPAVRGSAAVSGASPARTPARR